MEHYEMLFIVPGSLTDEEAPATVAKVKKLLEDLEGKIIKEDNWGRKKGRVSALEIDHRANFLAHARADDADMLELLLGFVGRLCSLNILALYLFDQHDPRLADVADDLQGFIDQFDILV